MVSSTTKKAVKVMMKNENIRKSLKDPKKLAAFMIEMMKQANDNKTKSKTINKTKKNAGGERVNVRSHLQDLCKNNGLKQSGTISELIDTICKGEVDTGKPGPKTKRPIMVQAVHIVNAKLEAKGETKITYLNDKNIDEIASALKKASKKLWKWEGRFISLKKGEG